MKEVYLDQYTYEHLPQAIALLDSDEWLQLFHPPVYPSEHEEIQKLRLAVSTVLTALSALRSPWVKTADRLPDAEQIARNDKIFLLCKQHDGAYEAYTHWADGLASHPEKFEFDYWMPVPPLPEVEK